MKSLNIIRDDKNKWILQKHISKKELFLEYLENLKERENKIDYLDILESSKRNFSYTGRSSEGSVSSMGVRMSEINFYMFGYKSTLSSEFVPTPISEEFLLDKIDDNKLFLGNMFMMQYPHPNSKATNLDLFFGRLIIKLLTDERINKRLYTDELVYYLPFIRSMNEGLYEELVGEILSYRKLSFVEKESLFKSVENYMELFGKLTHEMIYYFIRICENFEVVKSIEDPSHNGGRVFKFRQGKGSNRSTAIKSRGKYQGYIELNGSIFELALKLLNLFPFDQETFKLGRTIFTEEELSNDMFITQSYKLLNVISPEHYLENNIANILENMRVTSINSPDGKDFESALSDVFREFDEAVSVSKLSGPGKTDIFCVFLINDRKELFNIEAKSGSSGNNVNVQRIMRHLGHTQAQYCLMISPRFSRGTYLDIEDSSISTITSETLYQYCMKMLTSSNYRNMPYYYIHDLASNNLGKKLDHMVEDIIIKKAIYSD